MFKIKCYIIRGIILSFVMYISFTYIFDTVSYYDVLLIVVILLILDILLDNERIELDHEKVMIYGFDYNAVFNKKPKVILFNDIERIAKERISIPCFSYTIIVLKNEKKYFISTKDFKKRDLDFLKQLK